MAESAGVLDAVAKYATQLMDERVKLVRWHRRRACERQGIPYDEDVSVPPIEVTHIHRDERPPQPAPVEPAPQPTPVPQPAPANGDSSLWGKLSTGQKAGLGALALAALLGGGGTLWQIFGGGDDGGGDGGNAGGGGDTTIVQPDDREESLLQWLEDRGEHLPSGGSR